VNATAGDICVVGAGVGGLGAAITAARLGAKVILVERDPWLGGTATMGGVSVWQPGVCCAALPREIFQRLQARSEAWLCNVKPFPQARRAAKRYDPAMVWADTLRRLAPWTSEHANGCLVGFVPEAFHECALEMLSETGNCEVLLNTAFTAVEMATDPTRGPKIRAISADGDRGPVRVECASYVDATGDIFLARAAGVETHCGEDPRSRYGEPSAPQVASARLNGVTLLYHVGLGEGLERPEDAEDYDCDRIHGSADVCELPNGRYSVNNVFQLRGDEAHDMGLAQAHRVLSKRTWLYWDQTQAAFGMPEYRIQWIAPRLGLREGPRLVGRYVLTEHDFRRGMRGQEHDDIIAVAGHAMDVHGERSYCLEPPNGPYGIPFRCLQPREVGNLLVACRGASFSHLAGTAVRLQRTIMELGIAAGRALAGENPVPPRDHWDY